MIVVMYLARVGVHQQETREKKQRGLHLGIFLQICVLERILRSQHSLNTDEKAGDKAGMLFVYQPFSCITRRHVDKIK